MARTSKMMRAFGLTQAQVKEKILKHRKQEEGQEEEENGNKDETYKFDLEKQVRDEVERMEVKGDLVKEIGERE